MKNVFGCLVLAVLAMTLSGCAGTKTPTEFSGSMPSITTGEQAEVTGCREWLKDKEAQELSKYDRLQSNDMTYALMHRETMGMIKSVWGKDECKPGTNIWDAYKVYVAETEASHRQYSSDAKSVATFGIVTTGAVKLADAVMGKVGDKISTSGDNSAVNKTTTTTTTQSNAKSTNVGEGRSSATGGAAGQPVATPTTTSSTVNPAHWADCTTVSGGAASVDEINACMQRDYGYNTSVVDGQIYLDGKPYTP